MDSFFLGAFSGERPDSLDQWVDRFFEALQRLRTLDEPVVADWFAVASSRAASLASPLGVDRNSFRSMLERGRMLNDAGQWIEDLGYSLSAWNGRSDLPLRLRMTCCCHRFGLPNLFHIDLGSGPVGVGPDAIGGERIKDVVEVVAETLDPAWIVVASDAHLHIVQPGVRPWMSWQLYLRGDGAEAIRLPEIVERRKVGARGWMVSLAQPVAATDARSVAVANEIDELIGAAHLDLPDIPRPGVRDRSR